MLRNPVERALEKVTPVQFAIIGGVDVTVVSQCLRGHRSKLHPGVVKALQDLGFDPTQVVSDYENWRAAKAQEILAATMAAEQRAASE